VGAVPQECPAISDLDLTLRQNSTNPAAGPARTTPVTWISARRTASVLATLLVAGTIAFALLNRGAATGPPDRVDRVAARSATGTGSGAAQPAVPLVERMLDGLRDGRSVKSFDNPAAGAPVPAVQVANAVPTGRISIDAMELRSPFFEGVYDAVINKGPGHWPGTPLPGQAGNAVLSGHRATHGAEFFDLDVLRRGDKIDVRVGGRDRPLTYVVDGTRIVPQANYVRHVIRQPDDPDARYLTLFACDPVWDSTHRIVVRAQAAPVAPARAG